MTIEKSHEPNGTSSAQDRTASAPPQHTHNHTAQNATAGVTAFRLHPSTSVRNNSNNKKSCSPDTAPGLEVVPLSPSTSCKAPAPGEPRDAVPAAISESLTALLFSGAQVAALAGHTWLAQPEGFSIQHDSAPESLPVEGNRLCSPLGFSGCSGCSP